MMIIITSSATESIIEDNPIPKKPWYILSWITFKACYKKSNITFDWYISETWLTVGHNLQCLLQSGKTKTYSTSSFSKVNLNLYVVFFYYNLLHTYNVSLC